MQSFDYPFLRFKTQGRAQPNTLCPYQDDPSTDRDGDSIQLKSHQQREKDCEKPFAPSK